MSNPVLDRIQAQIKMPDEKPFVSVPIIETPKVTPLSTEKLRELLVNEFIEPAIPTIEPLEVKEFPSIYNFIDWYEQNQQYFSDKQQAALKTLVDARNMISQGCNCRRQSREQGAFAYYKVFWENNRANDLPATVLKITGAKRLTFGLFLNYP